MRGDNAKLDGMPQHLPAKLAHLDNKVTARVQRALPKLCQLSLTLILENTSAQEALPFTPWLCYASQQLDVLLSAWS